MLNIKKTCSRKLFRNCEHRKMSKNLEPNIANTIKISSVKPIDQQKDGPKYGLCPACGGPKTSSNWCPPCHSKLLLKENPGWTSGDKNLDDFIKQTIIDARRSYDYLEWIPYENFKNIKLIGRGGFATAYFATRTNCLKGHFTWDAKEKKYVREHFPDYDIALKCYHDRDNIAADFLNEVKTHHKCMMLQENGFLQCYGISKNPETGQFIIVLDYAPHGNLRQFLIENHKNLKWVDGLSMATKIAKDLKIIHEAGLIHCDFHSGNVLKLTSNPRVSDFGLSRLDEDYIPKDGVYGVIPYVAPEVLRGKSYRKPSDVYSFGIIMCEISSGKPAFYNVSHDFQLILQICNGLRPKASARTPKCYLDLMRRCLDDKPEKRPTAAEIYETCLAWYNDADTYQQFLSADKINTSSDEDEDQITFTHDKDIYSSRFVPYITTQHDFCTDDDFGRIILNN
ncbi:730_t:CDS:2 [Ambispora leptoticha]|uniref:730_t:CDS:1 n=1 Tax=Ambispora leptoticha TaxID=144679 RepID=A0A9N9H1R1_9GLOM|nr:730_t:CDS:2 [Ambispora leptoticha]